MKTQQETLRHFLATLAFRFSHVVADAPASFADFEAGQDVRTPRKIVRHMSGLILFVHHCFIPEEAVPLPLLSWPEEVSRFLGALKLLDEDFAQDKPLRPDAPALEKLWQGPLTDSATHIGQLATLRRLDGSPITKTSYARAEIHIGRFDY